MSAENEKERISGESPREAASSLLPTANPDAPAPKPESASSGVHASVYVIAWIAMSSAVILFNKYILDPKKLNFQFPIFLTTWHLAFGTLMTQVLARTTTLLDGRKKVKMTGRVYLRAVAPIGVFFSLSLICGNMTYLYLSVAFIQMLKATTPVAVLLVSWAMGLKEPSFKTFFNVSFIVIGVIIASFGEIEFVLIGFLFQIGGVIFEAMRLALVERLLSSSEFKMDPLVSFYYFAPICAIMNGVIALVVEIPRMSLADFDRVGYFTLLANACVAFLLNVCVVMLIGKTSSLVMTLCGVLKDILLVFASIAIYGTVVTSLQFFGYSIALGGLIYFRLGADQIKGYFSDGRRKWAEYGAAKPAQRKIIVAGIVIVTLFILMGGLAPAAGYDGRVVVDKSKEMYNGLVGNSVPAPPTQ
ncbi:MAG: hypothetical protein MMC23_006936 [Stictis urceolatum]|nr:hypothetical protein [Stictis urceolata]